MKIVVDETFFNTLPVLWARIENDVTGIGVEDFSFVVTSLMGKILSVVKLLLYTTTALWKNKKKP